MSDKATAIDNLRQVLDRFAEYLADPVEKDRDKAGIIQGFEFSFELTWKTIQKYAASVGVRFASPKQAFSFALKEGLIPIEDEHIWLSMMVDRNQTAHTYKASIADQVIKSLPNYLEPLRALCQKLQQTWTEDR